MTLAHELGHGVHQVLAARNGALMAPTPLTLAETASVFGEMLGYIPGVELGTAIHVGAIPLNDDGQLHDSGVSAAPSSGARGVAASGRVASSVDDSVP